MIKRYLQLLLSGFFLTFSTNVAGQIPMPDIVSLGQTRQYIVDPNPGSTYTWLIDGIVQTGFTTNKFVYTWNTSDTFLIEVQEHSAVGCAGPMRSGEVYVCPGRAMYLIIYDAFSPNGDLINDYWNIGNSEMYPKMEVTIYNRWGLSVWKSGAGYPVPWDGKRNGADVPIDSYHYAIDLHNGTKLIIGSITIVR